MKTRGREHPECTLTHPPIRPRNAEDIHLQHLNAEMERVAARKERCEAELAVVPEQEAARWEAILSSVPAAVEAYVDDLRQLLAEGKIAQVKSRLAEIVDGVVVEPHTGDGKVQLRIKGHLNRVLALTAKKCKIGGSPGGIRARLMPTTRVAFLLPSVHGVRRDRVPEAVKSALRFVHPAHPQRYAVAERFAAR